MLWIAIILGTNTGISFSDSSCSGQPPLLEAGEYKLLSPENAFGIATRQRISSVQANAFLKIKASLESGEDISITALGGSMMAGVDCSDGHLKGKSCSYSARFARALAEKYSCVGKNSSCVKYVNRASGGTTTAGSLPQLPILLDSAASSQLLVIIDFSVNDRFEVQDWTGAADSRKGVIDEEHVFAATEVLIRWVFKTHPQAALVMVEAYCERNSHSRKAHERAALVYGIPFVSYSSLLASGCNAAACGGRPCFRTPHPSFQVHEWIKHGLVMWWDVFVWRLTCPARSSALQPPTSSSSSSYMEMPESSSYMGMLVGYPETPVAVPALAELYHVCEKPLSVYDAREAFAGGGSGTGTGLRPVAVQGYWLLGADRGRSDKVAWTTSIDGSVLEFELSFGQSPRISIVHTKGYDETFGNAKVTIASGSPGTLILNGCCNDEMRATQGELTVVNAGQDRMQTGGGRGFSVKPFSKAKLRFEFQKGDFEKFSLSFVSSC